MWQLLPTLVLATNPVDANFFSQALLEIANGQRSVDTLTLRYRGRSVFHGNGEDFDLDQSQLSVTQQRKADTLSWKKSASPTVVRELAKLLSQERLWEQREPERAAIPDETRAELSLSIDGKSVSVWEWWNTADRTEKVRSFLLQFAPPPKQPPKR